MVSLDALQDSMVVTPAGGGTRVPSRRGESLSRGGSKEAPGPPSDGAGRPLVVTAKSLHEAALKDVLLEPPAGGSHPTPSLQTLEAKQDRNEADGQRGRRASGFEAEGQGKMPRRASHGLAQAVGAQGAESRRRISDNASQMMSIFTSSDAPIVGLSLEDRAHSIFKGPQAETKAKQVVDLFRAWDADGDGAISRKELRRLMRFATDGKANEVMLDTLMAKADSNGNGRIEFEEFAAWVYKQKIGMFSPEVKPSRICAAKSPVVEKALVKWFNLINANKNHIIEYEEFAIACMYVKPNVNVEDIDDEFDMLDPDGARKVTLDRFLHEYSRLLDAIPRPIEEKVELVLARCQRLDDALKASRSRRMSEVGAGGRDLQDFLQRHYASVRDALKELGWKNMEDLNIVQFRDALRELLGLPNTAPIELETLRRLFREYDKDGSGTISVEEIKGPQRTRGATNRRSST